MARLPKAYSPTDLQRMNIPTVALSDEWARALGSPSDSGVWLVWGASGSGKTSFAAQLLKEFASLGYRTAYNSLEQGASLSMRQTIERAGMHEVAGRFYLLSEDMETLSERLKRKQSPDVVVIDSLQYTGLTYREYVKFKRLHPRKLIILISHAEGANPEGRTAKRIQYDAEMKIFVEGYRAVSKGRYFGADGAYYTIWEAGAAKYWLGQSETETNN